MAGENEGGANGGAGAGGGTGNGAGAGQGNEGQGAGAQGSGDSGQGAGIGGGAGAGTGGGGSGNGSPWYSGIEGVDAAAQERLKGFADPNAAIKGLLAVKPAGDPGDFRKEIAGGDEKLQKRLERYQDVKSMGQALISLQNELSSGKYKRADPPKDATPEQLTQWRTENGLPADAKGYLSNLPDGLVIGEADMPIFEDFAGALHKVNADPRVAHEAVRWYNDFQQREVAAVTALDAKNATETESALRKEWGADYDANVNLRASILATAPQEVQDAWKSARLPDGTLLGEHPHLSRWLVGLQREINPTATILPAGINAATALSDEIAKLDKLMANDNSEYWKGPNSAKNQARYRELITARDKVNARAA